MNWYAMLALAGTPAAVVARINAKMVTMIADPSFAQRRMNLGSAPQSRSLAALAAYLRKNSERWARVIKTAGIKIDR